MGWFGYGIYDGDETQSFQISLLEKCKFVKTLKYEDISDGMEPWNSEYRDIIRIPDEFKSQFKKKIPLLVKSLPNKKFWDEDSAIEWQMFGGIFVDNDIKIPKKIKKKVIDATEFLMGEHASLFDVPSKRKAKLKNFLEKVNRL